jgi:alpha-L-fucosidase
MSVTMTFCKHTTEQQRQVFEPTFESLEKSNPVPEWFKDAKFGIYFHWGVYSTPAFANEWYPRNMYVRDSRENKHHKDVYGEPSEWPYNNFISGAADKKGNFVQFAPKLKSEGGNFDPDEWAQLFADAGAKFAGPVAEHHDGFSMWASKVNPWNAKDTGPKLDLVKLLTDAIRKKDMKVILSMHHAFNITGYYDIVPPTDDPKLQILFAHQGKEKNEALWLSKLKEIIDNYKPDILWQDFNLPRITDSVLLGFLSYYYNKAAEWNKEVVATYKDGLNPKCAVLDYERGGAVDITENYWLTDDAISSSSWCYTEGLEYYSKKQILHGFLDRISKNGNLLLNISPKADGTITREQKNILLAMGDWLKKYGEAVYSTRAWVKYGEGPTLMGSAQGVFGAPAEGKAGDVRFTRSKDNKTLYAILLGWDEGQKEIILTSLPSNRFNIKTLRSVELINGEKGKYLPLNYEQNEGGLIIDLPDRSFEEMAYVIKLTFKREIPVLDRYAEINCVPNYYLVPGTNQGILVLAADLSLKGKSKDNSKQWKIEDANHGFYKILSRENNQEALVCNTGVQGSRNLAVENFSGKENQYWRIDYSYLGLMKISNKQFPSVILSVSNAIAEGSRACIADLDSSSSFGWKLMEVCELNVEPFKHLVIPGIVDAEDFNTGCPGEAYNDRDPLNSGGQYRPDEQVDIEICEAGGFNITRTSQGEWLTYTVDVDKTATYTVSFYISSIFDNTRLHLECDGSDLTGNITLPNTKGIQTWKIVKKQARIDKGMHTLKLVSNGRGFNIDKMVFE